MEASVVRRDEEMQRLGDRIAELAAHIHAATYRLLVMVREFDEQSGWEGWKTCAQWLSWRTGIGMEAAREKVRVARALPGLPRIAAAFERGELSYSKVRALTRIAEPATEEALLMIAQHGTASQVERVVRGYRTADPERERQRANFSNERRYLATRRDEHGNLVIEGRLPAELGARFLKALEAAVGAAVDPTGGPPADEAATEGDGETFPRKRPGVSTSSAAERPTLGQRRADALVLLADSALDAGLPGRHAADAHQVIVHVDAAALADPAADGQSRLEEGTHVSAETSRRLACDSGLVVAREDGGGNTLPVGRRRRTVPPSLRRALANRDHGCRFPGCHHTRHLEAHHIHHWANGGETRLDNLVHLCSFHHRQLHEGGFRVMREVDGALTFRTPAGRRLEAAPAPPRPGSVPRLVHEHRALDIDGDTIPLWHGDPIDYDFAVAALLQQVGRDLELPAPRAEGRRPGARGTAGGARHVVPLGVPS